MAIARPHRKTIAGHNGGPDLDDDRPEDPGLFAEVWLWFLRFHKKRRFDGMSGLSLPIADSEVLAWTKLTGQPVAAHELRLLDQLDAIFIDEERTARSKKPAPDSTRTQDRRRLHYG